MREGELYAKAHLITSFGFPPWSLPHNHLVAILRSFGARLSRPCSPRTPAPDRHRMLIGF